MMSDQTLIVQRQQLIVTHPRPPRQHLHNQVHEDLHIKKREPPTSQNLVKLLKVKNHRGKIRKLKIRQERNRSRLTDGKLLDLRDRKLKNCINFMKIKLKMMGVPKIPTEMRVTSWNQNFHDLHLICPGEANRQEVRAL